MVKLKKSLIIDLLAFISLIIIAISGFILWILLPRGSSQLTTLIIQRHEWISIHTYCAVIFVLLILIHLILHSHYIKNFFKLISK